MENKTKFKDTEIPACPKAAGKGPVPEGWEVIASG